MYKTTNKAIGFLLSKCVTPQTNKFLCVRTTENAFALLANLLFKMYKTVNRQYKRNILRFYTTVNKLLFPVYEAMKNLQTLQQELRILCKKYNFCPLKGTRGTFYVFTQRLTNCCFLFTKQGKTCKHFNGNYAYFAKNTTFAL